MSRGLLTAAERDAVEEHLARSPADAELFLALQEFGDELPEQPPAAEREAAWERFAARLAAEPSPAVAREVPAEREPAPALAPVVPFPARSAAPSWRRWALAASLAATVLSSVVAVQQGLRARRAAEALAAPQADVAIETLTALESGAGDRSGSGDRVRIAAGAPRATFVLTPAAQVSADGAYEVRLADPAGREVWRSTLHPTLAGTFTLSLPLAHRGPGLYKIQVDETRGTQTIAVGRYEFELAAGPAGPR